MKNRFVLILLIVMAVLLPLSAAPTDGGSSGGFTPIYAAATSSDFVIRAYKNTSANVMMTIYDALTNTLDEIKLNQEINLYPHMAKFLDAKWDQAINTNAHKEKVLFSYLVTGNAVGKYELMMTFTAFKNESDPNSCINAQFDILSTRNKFRSGAISVGTSSIDETSKVKKTGDTGSRPATSSVVTTSSAQDVTITLNWNVANSDGSLVTNELWTAEGIVVMAIDQASYNNKGTLPGKYKSTVTVNLRTTE